MRERERERKRMKESNFLSPFSDFFQRSFFSRKDPFLSLSLFLFEAPIQTLGGCVSVSRPENILEAKKGKRSQLVSGEKTRFGLNMHELENLESQAGGGDRGVRKGA